LTPTEHRVFERLTQDKPDSDHCNSDKKGRFHVQKDRENSLFFKPVFLRLPSPQ
jgi:hypothetical protein